MAKATFGAGCFWGVEETFRKIPGVKDTAVGYSGGSLEEPTYEDVCTDRTGHAEVVEVDYDPSAVSYDTLLDVVLERPQPHPAESTGPGRRHAVSLGHLLPLARAGGGRPSLEGTPRAERPLRAGRS